MNYFVALMDSGLSLILSYLSFKHGAEWLWPHGDEIAQVFGIYFAVLAADRMTRYCSDRKSKS